MLGATARTAPNPTLDPNLLEAIRRLGSGAPMGSPLDPPMRFPQEGRDVDFAGRPVGNVLDAGAPKSPLVDMMTQPPAPSLPSGGGRGLAPLLPSPVQTGHDWGDEPPAPVPLPSGRMARSLVDQTGNPPVALNVNTPHIKPSFFGKGGDFWKVLSVMGPALMAAGGNQQGANQFINMQFERENRRAKEALERLKWEWEKKKDMRPEIKGVGRSLISVPFEGDPSVLYTDQTDADRYAASQGYQPGEEGYADAVMDYVLKSYGPTATGARQAFEGVKHDYRLGEIGARGDQSRQTVNYREGLYRTRPPKPKAPDASRPPRTTGEAVAPILAKMGRGEALTAGEQQVLQYYGNPRRNRMSFTGPPAAAPVRVRTPAEARALPKGTRFVTPDGRVKVR